MVLVRLKITGGGEEVVKCRLCAIPIRSRTSFCWPDGKVKDTGGIVCKIWSLVVIMYIVDYSVTIVTRGSSPCKKILISLQFSKNGLPIA